MSDDAPSDAAASSPVDAAYDLVYKEAIRSWTQQEVRLDELRTRTGVLVAAVTVATSFLGAAALGKPFQRLDVVALALYTIAMALSLIVLFPLPIWHFSMNIYTFLKIVESDPRPSLAETERHVSLRIANAKRNNDRWWIVMCIVFEVAVLAVVLMVLTWTWAYLVATGVTHAPF